MEHYQKYKKTIKEGVRKARRKRDIWINEYLAEKICSYCGEAETCALAFYPDNKKSESFQDRKDSEKNFDYRFRNGYKRIKLYV